MLFDMTVTQMVFFYFKCITSFVIALSLVVFFYGLFLLAFGSLLKLLAKLKV